MAKPSKVGKFPSEKILICGGNPPRSRIQKLQCFNSILLGTENS